MQVTFAYSQSLGSLPVLIEACNICISAGAILFASVLSTMFGRRTGPADLLVLRLWRSLATPFTEIVICWMGGVLEGRVGRDWVDLGVNTDLNCSNRISALPFLSLINLLLTLSGERSIVMMTTKPYKHI